MNAIARMQSGLERIGAYLLGGVRSSGFSLILAWRAARWTIVPAQLFKRRHVILRQMYVAGIESLPVTLIVGIFIGFLLTLSAGIELSKFGQQALVGQLAAVAVCREFGPFMTGLILAANVGSSMAAELGTMKVSEEIDALEVMSIDPARYLVFPRLLAMAVMTPLLTVFSDAVAIMGGAVVAKFQLQVSFALYYQNVLEGLSLKAIYTGLFKALIFGLIIAIVSCSEGLRTSGGAVGVGRATRRSVIVCYLLILIFGYFGTAVFYGKEL